MQFRVNASKTIARPQFRELIYQPYFDPDTNRLYLGNPFLTDSKLFNAEARYEWYFGRDQRVSLAGFYKKIDNPIEAFITFLNNEPATSFGNAPKADLYGGEAEVQKYFDMSLWSDGSFFDSRRLVAIANYTYTKSKLKVNDTDMILVYPASIASPSSAYFRNGAPLTGQSDHIVNLQLGFEDTDKLSQQTVILSYASKRVTSRGVKGPSAGSSQPDVYEYPGFNLDFVARQGISVGGQAFEVKFEARKPDRPQVQGNPEERRQQRHLQPVQTRPDLQRLAFENLLTGDNLPTGFRARQGAPSQAAAAPLPFRAPRRSRAVSRSAGPDQLAIPFGDDILGPAAHFHAVMEGVVIEPPVGPAVVPGEQLAALGLDRLVDVDEARRAAVARLVEIDHQRPGAVARAPAIGVVVAAAGLEIVGMRLEFLPGPHSAGPASVRHGAGRGR